VTQRSNSTISIRCDCIYSYCTTRNSVGQNFRCNNCL